MDGSLLEKLPIDRSVQPVSAFEAGQWRQVEDLKSFCNLDSVATPRAEIPRSRWHKPTFAYLHFGHTAPDTVAMAVKKADAPLQDRTAFLEELIVRRELAVNFVRYNSNYENFDSCEAWADVTLRKHTGDKRRFLLRGKTVTERANP